MAEKVIDVVGTSKESFAKAAENAVAEAAKTIRGAERVGLDFCQLAQVVVTTRLK